MTRRAELIGKRFGRLTVRERLASDPQGSARWKCQCDCGGSTVVTTAMLNAGNSTSCGCKRHDPSPTLVDMMGKRCGRLTVIGRHKVDCKGRGQWICQCDCGEVRIVCGKSLRSGNTQSCGCYQRDRASGYIGPNRRNWKGGRGINDQGYAWVLTRGPDGRRVRLEHHLVMEQHLGRLLTQNETVHHKNGIRSDNRLSNLELWTSKHPSGQRTCDLVVHAKEILRDYEPQALSHMNIRYF